MSTLNDLKGQYLESVAVLANARNSFLFQRKAFGKELLRVISVHKAAIGKAFHEAGQDDLYREHFGESCSGTLVNLEDEGQYFRLTFEEAFRGEVYEETFNLPARYVKGDWAAELEKDAARYSKVLGRLARMKVAQARRTSHEENLREFARLKALLSL